MFKRFLPLISFLLIIAAAFWGFYGSMPRENPAEEIPLDQFSTSRAFEHVKAMAQEPHYVGSPAHSLARNYIVSELQKMGLLVQTQEAYSLNNQGIITRPQNILTRIEGTGDGKALLLLTHYDSAMHSSFGASDDGSGVATILEGIRAFLAAETEHSNDVIIVFTDAEELGLNGAEIFVENHSWAEDVGLALNFEARGSGGPSIMLLETNDGNKALINHFAKADVPFPVTNSLAYSVYKMLPNDTDLTVLREKGNIPGFNFAFIDDHFDYHTANDIPENLDKNTLAHQGSYLMPLLNYFSNVPLEDLSSSEDLIYFSLPVFKMFNYPFSWIFPMLFAALIIFGGLLFFGFAIKKLHLKPVLKGFIPLLISFFGSGIIVFLFWKLCLFFYPEYGEILQGFPYNGYYYIAAVIFLSISICFYVYHKFQKAGNVAEIFVAPLFLWLVICTLLAIFLKGAAYFIIPVFFGLLQFAFLIFSKKPNLMLLTFLGLPSIFILMQFPMDFPVALGLGILFLSAILIVLMWVLLWPIFGFYSKKQLLGFLSFLFFIVLFVIAHFKSDFTEEHPKPNSLVYIFDADAETASWNTYDELLDEWTQPYFGENSEKDAKNVIFESKYNSGFSRTAPAPVINLPQPYVEVKKINADSSEIDSFQLKIAPRRNSNRIDLMTTEIVNFEEFSVNGLTSGLVAEGYSGHIFKNRWYNRLLSYFPVNRDTLRINFSIEKGENLQMILHEASYDLLENEALNVPPRPKNMIPKPFVSNDAVVIKKRIKFE